MSNYPEPADISALLPPLSTSRFLSNHKRSSYRKLFFSNNFLLDSNIMGKVWGSSSSGNEEHNSTGSAPQPERNGSGRSPLAADESGRRGEPNERTTLLRPHHLDPDDPAVSPYNRFSVRSLRLLSIFFLIVSFLWWLVLLVTTFISPPEFYTRGGGWFPFAYSTFAIGILFVLLLFYSTPSKTERSILLGVLLFLAVNTIIILAAYPIRNDEAWVGIASVLWTLFVTAWAVICDRVVEYGKHEEEVRLTGREETRYSLTEWFSVFAATILLTVFLVISVLFTISLSIRASDATLAPPGRLYKVDVYKYNIHINCIGDKLNSHGHKSTTVFLEGGEDPVEGRIESWVKDAYTNNTIKRYCYWDRPGMAWSDNGPSPLSAGKVADTLSTALIKANETGPWVLVSHGVGGIYSRVFASRHPSDIKGLLLIDAFPESLLHRLGSPGRGFILWLRGILYPLGIDRMVSAVFMGHSRQDRIIGRDAYQNGRQIKAQLQENLVATTYTQNEIDAARLILPRDTPIVVVSSGQAVKKSQEWDNGQRELTYLSDNNVAWDVVDSASHNVWENLRGKEILGKRLAQLVDSD